MRYVVFPLSVSLIASTGACNVQPSLETEANADPMSMNASMTDPALASWRYVDVGPDVPKPAFAVASVSGRLAISDGCIVLERTDGRVIELVFYEGSADFSEGVLKTDGKRLQIGSEVEFAGRGGKNDLILSEPSSSCPRLSRWYVSPQS